MSRPADETIAGFARRTLRSVRGLIRRLASAGAPEDAAALKRLVRSLDEVNKVGEAERLQRDFLERNPRDVQVLAPLLLRLNRQWRYEEAIAFVEQQLDPGVCSGQILLQFVRALVNGRGSAEARPRFERLVAERGLEQWATIADSELLLSEGRFDECARLLRECTARPGQPRFVEREARARLQRLQVFETSARILDAIPLRGSPRGVAVLATHGSPLGHLWLVPLAAELRKQGFATAILERHAAPRIAPSGDAAVDALHGMLDANRVRLGAESGPPPLRHAWRVEPEHERVEAEGINMARPIAARVGTKLRSYRFDWQHPVAQGILREGLQRADAALAVCDYIRANVAGRGLAVRFLAGMTHYPPAAVYRAWCDAQSARADVGYVAFTAGYEHYYTNLKNQTSTALSAANLTRHPELNLPSRVTRRQFESWMARLENRQQAIAEALRIVGFDRAGAQSAPEARALRRRVEEHRASGGKVACLFGKIMYDLWMDQPGGPAHADIADWLNHSIATVKGTNTLLLVKPHPNEVKKIIARPTERFYDLIGTALNDNVVLLDHTWFNMDAIASMIDLGLLWSGTSALELQASGVPVAVCSSWGRRDHPVRFLAPRDRAEYEAMLRDPGRFTVEPGTREECALLIKYYSTEEVLIPHRFGVMPYLRGVDIGGTRWDDAKVDDFIRNGDPHVARLAQRVL